MKNKMKGREKGKEKGGVGVGKKGGIESEGLGRKREARVGNKGREHLLVLGESWRGSDGG